MSRTRHKNIDEFVITDPSEARKKERILPEVWDQRFPEQERRYLDPRSVGELLPPPPHSQAAFEEVFHEEIRNKTVFFGLDPFLKRLCVYQKRQALDGSGEVVERAIIFSEKFDPDDLLPADLAYENHDGRYDRYEGCIGDFFVPDAQDFHHLKDVSDHWANSSNRELTYTRNWIVDKFLKKKMAAWRSAMNTQHDMWRDVYEYSYSAIYQRAVQALGGGQHKNFMPITSLDEYDREKYDSPNSKRVKLSVKNAKGEHLYWLTRDRAMHEEEVSQAAKELQEVDRKARIARQQAQRAIAGMGPRRL